MRLIRETVREYWWFASFVMIDVAPPTVEEMQEQWAQAMLQQNNVARVDSYRVPKIPPFLIKNTVIFIQVEATFEAARITKQKTKAYHVIMSLDVETIACCRDLIAEPDENEPN